MSYVIKTTERTTPLAFMTPQYLYWDSTRFTTKGINWAFYYKTEKGAKQAIKRNNLEFCEVIEVKDI